MKKKKAIEGSDKVSEKAGDKPDRREGGRAMTARRDRVLRPRPAGSVVAAACATPPKPRELEAYDLLRKANNVSGRQQEVPRSGRGRREARRAGRARNGSRTTSTESRRDAIMANIKLKTALALMEQEQLKAKIQTLSAQQAKAEEEAGDLTEKLANETEKLALLQKYVEARKAAETEKQRLSSR